LTGEEPRFEIAARPEPRGQAWDEVHRRLGDRPRYWPDFARFLRREAERQLTPARVETLELHWVIEPIARPGGTKPRGERRLLLRE
jgi:hypothetical protein